MVRLRCAPLTPIRQFIHLAVGQPVESMRQSDEPDQRREPHQEGDPEPHPALGTETHSVFAVAFVRCT